MPSSDPRRLREVLARIREARVSSRGASPERLRTFFVKLKQLSDADAKSIDRTPIRPLDRESFLNFVGQLHILASVIRDQGHFINVWEVAKLGSDEVRNAAVVAWLFDSNGSHGQGASIWRAFVERVLPPESRTFLVDPELFTNYLVRTEEYPLSDPSSRVDISIESAQTVLFIEVKIYAPEGENQLNRYRDLARGKAAALGKRWHGVIFLARVQKNLEGNSNLLSATWKDMAHAIDNATRSLRQSLGRRVLMQFADRIRRF